MIDDDCSRERNVGLPIGTAIAPTYITPEQAGAVAKALGRGLRRLGLGLAFYDPRLLAPIARAYPAGRVTTGVDVGRGESITVTERWRMGADGRLVAA